MDIIDKQYYLFNTNKVLIDIIKQKKILVYTNISKLNTEFDGNKFKVIIENKGLILINEEEEKRGNLIIQFVLSKDEMFDEKLLRFFS
jgi:hypothetical protein